MCFHPCNALSRPLGCPKIGTLRASNNCGPVRGCHLARRRRPRDCRRPVRRYEPQRSEDVEDHRYRRYLRARPSLRLPRQGWPALDLGVELHVRALQGRDASCRDLEGPAQRPRAAGVPAHHGRQGPPYAQPGDHGADPGHSQSSGRGDDAPWCLRGGRTHQRSDRGWRRARLQAAIFWVDGPHDALPDRGHLLDLGLG